MQRNAVLLFGKDIPSLGRHSPRSYEPSGPCSPPVCAISLIRYSRTYSYHNRLPDNCSYDQAALAEPLSVLLHASRRADLQSGQTVLVFGVGAIGLLACALAKSYGASRIVAIDINQTRLDFAKDNGFASQVHCLPMVDKAKTTEEQLRRAKQNVTAALQKFGEEDGFDVVFECTGAEACIQMAIHVSIAACFIRARFLR